MNLVNHHLASWHCDKQTSGRGGYGSYGQSTYEPNGYPPNGYGQNGYGAYTQNEEESSDEIDPDSYDDVGGDDDDDNVSVIEYDDFEDDDHHRNLSVNSVVLSPEELSQITLGLERETASKHSSRPKQEAVILSELISSMSDYLDSARQREREQILNVDHNGSNGVSEERAKQYVERSHFSVGKKVDVLDVSYQWYPATIVDIDVLSKKAVLIQYDDFDAIWNEWIPLHKSYRIAPNKSRIQIGDDIPSLKSERGGVHALITTKFGKSKHAQDLRSAFESDMESQRLSTRSVLIQVSFWWFL